MQPAKTIARLRPHFPAVVPGLLAVGLMLVWAVHDGGFDADTWYWGALVLLAALGASAALLGGSQQHRSRVTTAATALFALYVAWSYLSITWAQSPGTALDGSNRALLYLLLFTLLTLLPWTVEAAVGVLVTFAVGVGAIATVVLVRLASADHVGALIVGGRLSTPTGYFNATAALFTIGALVSVGLASRRELPGPLRGLLLALAGASLQLAVVVQSRGWLFTLPLVIAFTGLAVGDRLRVAAFALIPIAATLIPVHGLLRIYDTATTPSLDGAAAHAGQEALVLFGAAFVLGTLLAWADQLARVPALSIRVRRVAGGLTTALAIAGLWLGLGAVSHGHPGRFISRQWHGFSHPQQASTTSHFADVGSGRYDFWRVALDAFVAHPVGGLGQDNFAEYYVRRRHVSEEPEWTHSLELRLLAHTGVVGFGLFAAFLVLALVGAVRARRRGPPLAGAVAGVALLPLIVWLVHGSLDWFWEMPALSGPALGFLAIAGRLAPAAPRPLPAPALPASADRRRRVAPRPVKLGLALLAMLAAAGVLGFPYLSVREVSRASDVQAVDPAAALADLRQAAQLNPLNADPGLIAGAVALRQGEYGIAASRFRQSISIDSGGWFDWLGAGLAASALGERATAHRDFVVAYSINSRQAAVRLALERVYSRHPLTSAQAFSLFVIVQ